MIRRKLIWSSIVVVACAAGIAAGSTQPSPARPDAAQIDRGRRTFVRVGCYECHGRDAQGASTGPRLGPNPIPLDAFTRAVRTPRNEMPPYGRRILSDDELADIYAFVRSRPPAHSTSAAVLPSSLSPIVVAAALNPRGHGYGGPLKRSAKAHGPAPR